MTERLAPVGQGRNLGADTPDQLVNGAPAEVVPGSIPRYRWQA